MSHWSVKEFIGWLFDRFLEFAVITSPWIVITVLLLLVFTLAGAINWRNDGSTAVSEQYTTGHDRVISRNTFYPEYRIEYADADGVVTTRDIAVEYWHKRGSITVYTCWCFLRNERRTFRSDRILSVVNLETNRTIKDISAHQQRRYG